MLHLYIWPNELTLTTHEVVASLSSTDVTCYYVNIDYPPLTALRDALPTTTDDKKKPLPPPKIEQFVASTGDNILELSISSILENSDSTGNTNKEMPPATSMYKHGYTDHSIMHTAS